MNAIFENVPLSRQEYDSAIYEKPASVGEYHKRPELRKLGILPGDNIGKMVSPKLIPVSEFHFETVEARLKWERHYKYLNLKYGMGLEAAYMSS